MSTLRETSEEIKEAWVNNNAKALKVYCKEIGFNDPSMIIPEELQEQNSLFERGVKSYGGGFVRKLLAAYRQGDPINRRKIRSTWPDLWIEYVVTGRDLESSDK